MAPRFHALLYRRLTVRSHLRPSTPPPLSRSQAQEEHNSSVDGRLTALESVQKIAHEKIVRVLKRMSQQSRSLSIHREQHRELAAALDTVGEETRGLIAREGASDAERVEMRIQLATQLDQARTIVRDQAALQQQRVAQQAEIQQQKVALQQQQAEIQQQKVALQQQQAALEQQEAALQQQQAEMEAANAEHDDLLARFDAKVEEATATTRLARGEAAAAMTTARGADAKADRADTKADGAASTAASARSSATSADRHASASATSAAAAAAAARSVAGSVPAAATAAAKGVLEGAGMKRKMETAAQAAAQAAAKVHCAPLEAAIGAHDQRLTATEAASYQMGGQQEQLFGQQQEMRFLAENAMLNSLQAFSQTQALAQGHAELAQQQQLWQGQAPTTAQYAALDEEADALLAEIEEVEPLGY